jgi:hypothetical protein
LTRRVSVGRAIVRKYGPFGVIRRREIPKNEAKSSGIWAALSHLAKMLNGTTKKVKILFKKTLTQIGASEKLASHTE